MIDDSLIMEIHNQIIIRHMNANRVKLSERPLVIDIGAMNGVTGSNALGFILSGLFDAILYEVCP